MPEIQQRWVCSTFETPLDAIHLRQTKNKCLQGARNTHDILHFLICHMMELVLCLMSNVALMTSS